MPRYSILVCTQNDLINYQFGGKFFIPQPTDLQDILDSSSLGYQQTPNIFGGASGPTGLMLLGLICN